MQTPDCVPVEVKKKKKRKKENVFVLYFIYFSTLLFLLVTQLKPSISSLTYYKLCVIFGWVYKYHYFLFDRSSDWQV